MNKNNIIMNNA